MEIVKGGETVRWGGTYFEDINQRETRFTELIVFETFRPKISADAQIAKFVFLANINPDLQLQVLDQCRSARLVVLDTMNLWINIQRDALTEAIRRCDIIMMNDEEARQFAETQSLEQAARKLLKLGCKRAIIKKGEHGCLMFSEKGFFAAPALPIARVKDPTGAGDTFAGGFIGYLARHGSLSDASMRQAILAGTALASFCVEDFSVRKIARLKKPDLRARARQLSKSIACPAIQV